MLRWAPVWNLTRASVFSCLLVTYRHTHTHISFCSAYHPHVGKNLQLLQISPFRQSQKRDPCLSQASRCALNGPAKVSSAQPVKTAPGGHIPNLGNYGRLLPVFPPADAATCPCEFTECSIVCLNHSRPLHGVLA